jgi:hypothetical protein
MGHDITILNKNTGERWHTYITFNYSNLSDKYPGIYAIHGHSNNTVIRILKKTLTKLLNDDIVPCTIDIKSAYGDKDSVRNLECYAACLQEFLKLAIRIKRDSEEGHQIYWYSDQVWAIQRYEEETNATCESIDAGYFSDGAEKPSQIDDYDSDDGY